MANEVNLSPNEFGMILLDINMPQMDRYQVMEILKSDDSLIKIPVIALTAHAMERDFQCGKAAGFADYLTEPLDLPPFLETIERCLARA